jgi:hypothetical protein
MNDRIATELLANPMNCHDLCHVLFCKPIGLGAVRIDQVQVGRCQQIALT